MKSDFCELARSVYELIDTELKGVESGKLDVIEAYPKLVVSCEFLRYIRGEFFSFSRPPLLDCQKELYRLEDEVSGRVEQLRKKLDLRDPRTKYFFRSDEEAF